MNEKSSAKKIIFIIIPIVLGIISFLIALAFFLFSAVWGYQKCGYGSLITAVIAIIVGIIIAFAQKNNDKRFFHIVGIVVSVLLPVLTFVILIAMFVLFNGTIVYDNYERFSKNSGAFLDDDNFVEIPKNAYDCRYLISGDGTVNAVSYIIPQDDIEEFKNNFYQGGYYGYALDEYSKETYSNCIDIVESLKFDDDINDYFLVEGPTGNEWQSEGFFNEKTGRYILVITHIPY